jgi:presenilin-like A22 family membrane protease
MLVHALQQFMPLVANLSSGIDAFLLTRIASSWLCTVQLLACVAQLDAASWYKQRHM